MEAITIRTATACDLSSLAVLEAACFPDAWGREAIEAHLSSKTGISLIAERCGNAVGYLLGLCLPPEAELYRIAVLPTVRREGLGRRIMHGLFDILSKNSVEACFLEVREGNSAARALYNAYGFAEVGRRRGYYKDPREDALVMRREFDVSSVN